MTRLSARFLGALDLRLTDLPITTLEYDKVRALLVYLMVESDQAHRRESLVGLLWPDSGERAARQSLSQALSVLRSAIGDREVDRPCLHITVQTLQFNTASDYTLDVSGFTALIDAVQQHTHSDLLTCSPCLLDLEQAAALYRGNFMAGFSLPKCPEFEIWLTLVRERLQQWAMNAFDDLAKAFLLSGNYGSALNYAQRQLTLDNLREPAYRQAMTALALCGQRSAALAQYETCKRVLRAELGIPPEPATVALSREISSGALNGEQQAGKPRYEAHAALQVTAIPNNLTYHVSPIIGRQDLLELVQLRLLDADCRLVTLLGPGGCGKTRLAQEIAWIIVEVHDRDRFDDGVYFVPLAAIETVEGIVPAIAQAIKLNFASEGEPDRQLAAYLSRKHTLLVLDNFEHLIHGAGLVVDLLRSAPHLKILVTTRVKLTISTEQVFNVPGMVYPDDAGVVTDIKAYSALLLFQQFARRVQPDFAIDEGNLPDVVMICRLVHGMPLGLLLASAWMHILEPSEIVIEIERSLDFLSSDWLEVPPRQRSMRAMFEHSWNLLSAKEQRMLASLAVFKGGWTREAALEVAEVSLRDLLTLINKCLVQRGSGGRYGMHELLWQFASECLGKRPQQQTQVRDAHGAVYVNALIQWSSTLRSPQHANTLIEITTEFENVITAVNWMVQQEHLDAMVDALDCFCYYFEIMRRYRDGEQFCVTFAEKLELYNTQATKPSRAMALAWACRFAEMIGEIDGAHAFSEANFKTLGLTYETTLSIDEQTFPRAEQELRVWAHSLHTAAVAYRQQNVIITHRLFNLSCEIYHKLHDQWHEASVLLSEGVTYAHSNETTKVFPMLEKALGIYESLQDPYACIVVHQNLGHEFIFTGEVEQGEKHLRKADQLAAEYGIRHSIVNQRARYFAFLLKGRFEPALEILRQEKIKFEALGLNMRFIEADAYLAHLYLHLGEYETARQLIQTNLEKCITAGYDLYTAHCYTHLCRVALGQGDYDRANELYAEAVRCEAKVGSPKSHWAVYPYILFGLGLHERNRILTIELLQNSVRNRDKIDTEFTLTSCALIYSLAGLVIKAVELYALACRQAQIANSKWFDDIAGRHVREAAASLPPDVVAAAEARGRELDLWQTAEELLVELEQVECTFDGC